MGKRKLETLETEEGNTKPPPKRCIPSKRWCFTYNNYPDNAVETLETVFKTFGGEEVGELEETPHLQGYIEAPQKIRPIEKLKLPKEISWRACRGDRTHNIEYCSKECGAIHSSKELAPKKPLSYP